MEPKQATEQSAGYDVYLPANTEVKPGRQVIPLNFSLEISRGYEAKIEPRSGFSSKGMEGADGRRHDADVITGKVDADYRGIVGVIVDNHEGGAFWLSAGLRIAQMTFYKAEKVTFVPSERLSETKRGNGGFGHSGSGNGL